MSSTGLTFHWYQKTDKAGLGLAQIYPVWDEDTSDERPALYASFTDPYLAIIRSDASLLLLQADDSGDIDEVELTEDIVGEEWRSCCLYQDKSGMFSPAASHNAGELCLILLSSECKLSVSIQPAGGRRLRFRSFDCTTRSCCLSSRASTARSLSYRLSRRSGPTRGRR